MNGSASDYLSKLNKEWYSVFSTVLEHSRVAPVTKTKIGALNHFLGCKIFLRAGNKRVVFRKNTAHPEPLFIALVPFAIR